MTEDDDSLGCGYMTVEQRISVLYTRLQEYKQKARQAESLLRELGYKGLT